MCGPGLMSFEVLVSIDIVLRRATQPVAAAAAPRTSNLTCYCSVATAACIFYRLTSCWPTLFWLSCQ